MTGRPEVRELEKDEAERILARNHVGRIGFARENRIEIQPVHYVFDSGWIWGRTSAGRKYEALGGTTAYQWWPVVFEVDEIEDLFHWRSVQVHGGFYIIPEEGSAEDAQVRARAIDILRTLIPETLRAGDPFPFRTVLFRIAVQELSGREARLA